MVYLVFLPGIVTWIFGHCRIGVHWASIMH
jgi:hypothetical protein